MVKTITVTDDAYEMLKKMKSGDESFSEVIKRVAKPTFRLSDYFGIISKEAGDRIANEAKKRRGRLSKDIEARRNASIRHFRDN